MKHIFIILFGALVNRIRGGGHGVFRRWVLTKLGAKYDSKGKLINPFTWYQWIVNRFLDGDTINAVAFGLSVALVPSAVYKGLIDGVPHYRFENPDWVLALFAAIAMFAGAAPGWGKYIGALGGWEKDNLVEWPPIDKLIEKYKDRPKLWGFLGLTLRGFVWGFLIGLALTSFWPMVGGALMGCVYWVGLKLKGREGGWPLSEWLFGGVFWLFCFI